MSEVEAREAVARAHQEEWARLVAALTRRFGDLDVAEEAAAEAFATAVERWPADGVPPNPGAWLTTTAQRKAIDRIRRETKRDGKQKEARMLYVDEPPEPLGPIDDAETRAVRRASVSWSRSTSRTAGPGTPPWSPSGRAWTRDHARSSSSQCHRAADRSRGPEPNDPTSPSRP